MNTIRDRLFVVHADHASPAATHDAVTKVAALLLECCTERPTYSDLIVDAVMDALARVRPGWVRTEDDPDSTGCPPCDAVLDILGECHGMSLSGATAAEVAWSARECIDDLIVERDGMRDDITRTQAALGAAFALSEHGLAYDVERLCEVYTAADRDWNRAICERDEARAEAERLRAEVASLREQSGDNDCDDAPDTDEPAGWEPALQWNVNEHGQRVVVNSSGRTVAWVDDYGDRPWCFRAGVLVDSLKNPWRSREDCTDIRAAMRWCEQQPEMADIIAAYTSAPTVGATDAGPDAPALIVEGDGDTGALQESAVPAAPVSGAEQSCGEAGVDRPSTSDERIVGPREGEDWIGMGKHAGTSPYGYDVDTSGDDPVLVTNQVEADTMLLLCEWRDAGVSAQTMAKRLNDIGRRTRSGCAWTASSVRSRLLSAGSGYDEWHEVGR